MSQIALTKFVEDVLKKKVPGIESYPGINTKGIIFRSVPVQQRRLQAKRW